MDSLFPFEPSAYRMANQLQTTRDNLRSIVAARSSAFERDPLLRLNSKVGEGGLLRLRESSIPVISTHRRSLLARGSRGQCGPRQEVTAEPGRLAVRV
jgi:hypothetical protein